MEICCQRAGAEDDLGDMATLKTYIDLHICLKNVEKLIGQKVHYGDRDKAVTTMRSKYTPVVKAGTDKEPGLLCKTTKAGDLSFKLDEDDDDDLPSVLYETDDGKLVLPEDILKCLETKELDPMTYFEMDDLVKNIW